MKKVSIGWWFKSKWIIARQTCQQLFNFFRNQLITPRGNAAYDYYCKVIFDNYEPVSYAEMTYEFDMKALMDNFPDMDRKTAAIYCAGNLAKHIAPWDFKKKEHKIVSY